MAGVCRLVADAANAPACRYDHRAKHEGGWTVHRIDRAYRWTSRLGHDYDVPDPPVARTLPDPLPDPPGRDLTVCEPPGDTDGLGRPWQNSGIIENEDDDRIPF